MPMTSAILVSAPVAPAVPEQRRMRISAQRSHRTLITTGLNFDLAPLTSHVAAGASSYHCRRRLIPIAKGACNGAAHQQRICDDTAMTRLQYIISKVT